MIAGPLALVHVPGMDIVAAYSTCSDECEPYFMCDPYRNTKSDSQCSTNQRFEEFALAIGQISTGTGSQVRRGMESGHPCCFL